MARELMPQGIHVANVPIDAAIGWRRRTARGRTAGPERPSTTTWPTPTALPRPICSCIASTARPGRSKSRCGRGPRSGDGVKAFIVERYGGGDALRLGDMPEPELRDDDVLVRVHAAGVNPLDSKIRDGEFKLILPYRLPLILGNDVAGVVVRVGPACGGSSPATRSMRGRARSDRHVRRIHRDQRGRRGDQAREAHHGRSRFHPAGRPDRLAGAGRASPPEEGAEGPHPRRLRRRRHLCHPAGQASRRDRRDDDEHSQRRAREEASAQMSSIDYRKDDFENVLRDYDVVLNSLGKETLEKSLRGAEARRKAHLDLRPARSRLCQGHRLELDAEAGHAPAELSASGGKPNAVASAIRFSS